MSIAAESASWGRLRPISKFEKLEQIGEGAFGQVYKAREIETREIVALKKIRIDNYHDENNPREEGFPTNLLREIQILKKLDHQNVIKLKEIVTSSDEQLATTIYMVFEYMDHDLYGLSDRPGVRFSTPQIKCYMKQLLTGLLYCHENRVLHRDIKSSNLLIDNQGNLKLADFGLARLFSSENSDPILTNRVVTLWYRPPELLLGSTDYGPEVDIWSAGCILGELLHGKPLFPGRDEADQLKKIFYLCGTPDEGIWPGVSKFPRYGNYDRDWGQGSKGILREVFKYFDREALDLLEKMLSLDPAKRVSAREALDSDYFVTEPLPCDPKSLPEYESSHEFRMRKRRVEQRQQRRENGGNRQNLELR